MKLLQGTSLVKRCLRVIISRVPTLETKDYWANPIDRIIFKTEEFSIGKRTRRDL